METITMKVADIKPAKYNPRKTLKPGDEEYEALSRSVDKFGMAVPIIINKTTGTLISGHQRLNVLKAKGVEEVEVVLTEQTEENEKLLNIALNKIEGDWDYKKLEALFEEISAEDIQFTGFTPEELNNLFDNDLPNWEEGEADGAPEEAGSSTGGEEDEDDPQEAEKEFNIFLSFPTKELAEKWLEEKKIDGVFKGQSRNVTVRMEGLGYGKGN